MSLKSKIEAVIYASEEPVTLAQLVGLLAGEAQDELDVIAADQAQLPLGEDGATTQPADADDDLITAETIEAMQADAEEPVAAEEPALESEAEPTAQEPEETPAEDEAAPQETVDAAPAETPEADGEEAPAASSEETPAASSEADKRIQRDREKAVRDHLRRTVDALIRDYAESDRGIEIREVASGFRMGTKPEYHDAVRGFVKSLKPPLKLTLQALETLAVVAYKQPVTAAEISEIRGVDSAGVLGGLMTRKLIATAGRKQVIGRPMLYKTTRDFLLRFGLKDVNELPSMEEFERMAGELAEQEDLPMEHTDAIIEEANARGDAEMLRQAREKSDEVNESSEVAEEDSAEANEEESSEQPEAVEGDTSEPEAAEPETEGEASEQPAEAEASPVAEVAPEAAEAEPEHQETEPEETPEVS